MKPYAAPVIKFKTPMDLSWLDVAKSRGVRQKTPVMRHQHTCVHQQAAGTGRAFWAGLVPRRVGFVFGVAMRPTVCDRTRRAFLYASQSCLRVSGRDGAQRNGSCVVGVAARHIGASAKYAQRHLRWSFCLVRCCTHGAK